MSAARNAQHLAHRFILRQWGDYDGLSSGQILTNFYGRAVTREGHLRVPRQHAHIKTGCIIRKVLIRDGRKKMNVRQMLNLEAA